MPINRTPEVTYEVLEECGTISQSGKWEMKLRYMSWKGRDPRYDLRRWTDNGDGTEKCGKGITLTGEELEALRNIINAL